MEGVTRMFEATRILFIYVETPLHAGTGRGLGAVDLPIQRERTTGYPIVQASSLKGRLRAAARGRLDDQLLVAIFGPETSNASGNASDHAGALSAGDARLLLFPVRSLAGVFAWTTSRGALARFCREAALANLSVTWSLPPALPDDADACYVNGASLVAGDQVVLEEYSFRPVTDQAETVGAIGGWLAEHALPSAAEYAYWREALPHKLCILPEDAFRDFVQYATEVQTHVKLDPETKTVARGALWTAESLPTDTLMYAPLLATRSRRKGVDLSGERVLMELAGLGLARTQLGGDETTGQGIVALRMTGGAQ
jgi:CRISPR-associated protein Cmr4